MKNSRTYGAEHPALPFEVVAIPVLPAHDRAPAPQVQELPDYVLCRLGHKADLARRWAPTRPGGLHG